MSQYKGKREYSGPDHELNNSVKNKNGKPAKSSGDPFAGEKVTFGKRIGNFFGGIGRFFFRGKGRILIGILCTLLVLFAGIRIGWGLFKKTAGVEKPDVTKGEFFNGGNQEDQRPNDGGEDIGKNPEEGNTGKDPVEDQNPENPGLSDDDLYPDDGYSGTMPSASGDRKTDVYTFLLVGTDMDDGNTDTIMVATYDTVNQKISIMSIPRDTMINKSWDIKKINSVYSREGMKGLFDSVEKLIGFRPDFYVKVDLNMFVELVNLVGGVEFYVPQDMKYDDPQQDLHIDLKEGKQVLDGEKAMQLVRFRGYAEGDIRRVAVQQDFLKALIKECLNIKHWGKIKAYINLAMENIQTDLGFGSVVWFAANVMGLNEAPMLKMSDVYTCTLPGNYWASTWSRATSTNQSYVTIYVDKTVKLVNERFNPYLQDVTADMIDAMSILENGDIKSSTGVLKDTKHNLHMALRRGEAYYDENGNIVMGDPNAEPKTEDPENGEESGAVTDPENGEESGAVTAPENGEESGDVTDPENGEESGDVTDPENGEEANQNGGQDSAGEETGEEEEPAISDDPTIPDEPVVSDEPTIPADSDDEDIQ